MRAAGAARSATDVGLARGVGDVTRKAETAPRGRDRRGCRQRDPLGRFGIRLVAEAACRAAAAALLPKVARSYVFRYTRSTISPAHWRSHDDESREHEPFDER